MEFVNPLLIIGIVFTFFIPGFLVVETFLKTLEPVYKAPLYLLLSVLLSTYYVFFLSLFLGYSASTIFLSFYLQIPWLVILVKNRWHAPPSLPRPLIISLGLATTIFLVFFTALSPGIFTRYGNDYVMSAVNWQDTAMHLGIIESVAVGNFPPQAPYFSGVPLSYYYFADFHTSILQTLVGAFMPRLLVIDNPFFVLMFSLSVFALAYHFCHKASVSALATLLSVFAANMMYLRFASDLSAAVASGQAILAAAISLVTNNAYTLEYGKLIQMTPMVDYFLQNRPMMVGLPAVVLVTLLSLLGFEKKEPKYVLFAGLITGMLIKFQVFAFGVSALLAGVVFLFNFSFGTLKKDIKLACFYLVPVSVFSLFILAVHPGQRSFFQIVSDSFRWGPWETGKSLSWFIQFYPTNFNLPFFIAVFSVFYYLVKKQKPPKFYIFLYLWLVLMFSLPHLASFTIYEGDMFKFFYFMMIPVTIITAIVLSSLWSKRLAKLLVPVILTVSCFTPLLTLTSSILNKSVAYSTGDLATGLWIRDHTPINSVFLGLPTVHTPIDQIGGRLRVLSYTVWPYSHGYNTGPDNVFTREDDIKSLYADGSDTPAFSQIASRYNVSYIYYGGDERSEYPQTQLAFDGNPLLKKVYQSNSAVIYQLLK